MLTIQEEIMCFSHDLSRKNHVFSWKTRLQDKDVERTAALLYMFYIVWQPSEYNLSSLHYKFQVPFRNAMFCKDLKTLFYF